MRGHPIDDLFFIHSDQKRLYFIILDELPLRQSEAVCIIIILVSIGSNGEPKANL